MIVITDNIFEVGDVSIASEEYSTFIKVVIDVNTGRIAAGGEWHADAEKVMLETGSLQDDLWGGGINIVDKKITFTALINMRPKYSRSQEVLDINVRNRMVEIINRAFGGGYE